MSKITIADIRNYLGLARAEHDQKWAELRVRGVSLCLPLFIFFLERCSSIHVCWDA
jgi:hypothetical protein